MTIKVGDWVLAHLPTYYDPNDDPMHQDYQIIAAEVVKVGNGWVHPAATPSLVRAKVPHTLSRTFRQVVAIPKNCSEEVQNFLINLYGKDLISK